MSVASMAQRSNSMVERVTRQVHHDLLESDGLLDHIDEPGIRNQVRAVAPLLDARQVDEVATRVAQQLFGLGPLEPLLKDPTITELMVNGPGPVWVERDGDLAPSPVHVDAPMLELIIERILAPLGLRVDRTAPLVDARLPDGSRVNVAVPPLAIDGPYLTVRRFRASALDIADFATGEVAALLGSAVHRGLSLIVSGGTGSGKTSLLNALAAHLSDFERVVTIEDAAELRLPGVHTVRLEARPANAEGVGGVSVRALVRNALRMRPDRLVIGEVRGAEALDMIQAMNTGHNGSMSTCHANSAPDALYRIEAMALMGDGNIPLEIIRGQLLSAVDLVIHVERACGGARRVGAVYACGSDYQDPWLVRDGLQTPTGREWMALDG